MRWLGSPPAMQSQVTSRSNPRVDPFVCGPQLHDTRGTAMVVDGPDQSSELLGGPPGYWVGPLRVTSTRPPTLTFARVQAASGSSTM